MTRLISIHSYKTRLARLMRIAFATMAVLGSLSLNTILSFTSVGAASCEDVRFVFARGSGESLRGASEQAWRKELTEALSHTSITYGFYELGTKSQGGYQYPAVSVSDGVGGILNLGGAMISGGQAFKFGDSVNQGIEELKTYLSRSAKSCPRTKFVLGGYSQGGMVLSKALGELDSSRIIYAATFGDPKLYLPEGESRIMGLFLKIPDACYGRNLSDYRAYVPDCYAHEGILGRQDPYQTRSYIGKLGAWCNGRDIMCSYGASLSDHGAYVTTDLYRDAARVIIDKIAAAFPDKLVLKRPTDGAKHDVAIVIDSTASMRSLIDRYKTEAKRLASRVLSRGGRISLFEYRDLEESFATKMHCDFTCTLEDFTTKIDAIKTAAGGDTPESALSAILYALNSLDWLSGATKSLILLTDAPFHSPDRDGTTIEEVVTRSLEIDPVNIYAMTERSNAKNYTALTAATGGQVFDINIDLSESTELILGRPVAKLALAEYAGAVGAEFSFDASGSYSLAGADLQYDWDLDGDGKFELANAGSLVTTTYTQPLSGFVQVKVSDAYDNSSTMSAKLTVLNQDLIQARASISDLASTPKSQHAAEISFTTTDANKVLLVVEDAPIGFIDVAHGAGNFVLNDISAPVTVTLIPYSDEDLRGIAQSITASPQLPKVPNTAAHSSKLPQLTLGFWASYINL